MSACCNSESYSSPEPETNQALCPRCHNKGLKVKAATLEAMLSPKSTQGVDLDGFRFCRTKNCQVAYFGPHHSSFTKEQVLVSIYQKEEAAEVYVCYCYQVTRGDVCKAVGLGKGEQLHQQLKTRKDQEGCDCEYNNPQGSCCFGNVKAAIKTAETRLQHS